MLFIVSDAIKAVLDWLYSLLFKKSDRENLLQERQFFINDFNAMAEQWRGLVESIEYQLDSALMKLEQQSKDFSQYRKESEEHRRECEGRVTELRSRVFELELEVKIAKGKLDRITKES